MTYNFYLWYVPREKRYFTECIDCYNGFVIAAHILAHNGNAFAKILNDTNKTYFIDPETSCFQHADLDIFFNDNGDIRSSWHKLIGYYGSLVEDALNDNRLLLVTDFKDANGRYNNNLYELTNNVLNYQEIAIKDKAKGLSRLINSDTIHELEFIVSPYFYYTSISDPWFDVTIEAAKITARHNSDKEKYAVISASKRILNDREIETISREYNIEGIDGILLWIDDFNGVNEITNYLSNYIKLIHALSTHGKKVINLYGEFFSILTSYWGLTGHASGVRYRESRSSYPIQIRGGPSGGPVPRYYIPRLHTKVTLEEGVRLISQFNDLGCDCDICTSHPDAYDANTTRALQRYYMTKHFLTIRRNEVEVVSNTNYDNVFLNLERVYNVYSNRRGIVPMSHLNEWNSAIQDNISLLA